MVRLVAPPARAVITAGAASISHLQRTLGVGYARAAKLIDMLEERGVVTSAKGTQPRELVLSKQAEKVLKKIETQLKKKNTNDPQTP